MSCVVSAVQGRPGGEATGDRSVAPVGGRAASRPDLRRLPGGTVGAHRRQPRRRQQPLHRPHAGGCWLEATATLVLLPTTTSMLITLIINTSHIGSVIISQCHVGV